MTAICRIRNRIFGLARIAPIDSTPTSSRFPASEPAALSHWQPQVKPSPGTEVQKAKPKPPANKSKTPTPIGTAMLPCQDSGKEGKVLDLAPPNPQNPAESIQERLLEYICEFESGLSAEEEVGGRAAQFGDEVIFHIEGIGSYAPDLLCIFGVDGDGNRMQLLQHYTQVNILLVAVRKTQEVARRIGFSSDWRKPKRVKK